MDKRTVVFLDGKDFTESYLSNEIIPVNRNREDYSILEVRFFDDNRKKIHVHLMYMDKLNNNVLEMIKSAIYHKYNIPQDSDNEWIDDSKGFIRCFMSDETKNFLNQVNDVEVLKVPYFKRENLIEATKLIVNVDSIYLMHRSIDPDLFWKKFKHDAVGVTYVAEDNNYNDYLYNYKLMNLISTLNNGYSIVAGDEDLSQILAESVTSKYDMNAQPVIDRYNHYFNDVYMERLDECESDEESEQIELDREAFFKECIDDLLLHDLRSESSDDICLIPTDGYYSHDEVKVLKCIYPTYNDFINYVVRLVDREASMETLTSIHKLAQENIDEMFTEELNALPQVAVVVNREGKEMK